MSDDDPMCRAAEAMKKAGGWIADGNTRPEVLRAILQLWEDGDPEAPAAPSPFSGEWADGPAVWDVIRGQTDLDPAALKPEEVSDLADAYESAFAGAWYAEAERTDRGLLRGGK
jgi:hypothetical protein